MIHLMAMINTTSAIRFVVTLKSLKVLYCFIKNSLLFNVRLFEKVTDLYNEILVFFEQTHFISQQTDQKSYEKFNNRIRVTVE